LDDLLCFPIVITMCFCRLPFSLAELPVEQLACVASCADFSAFHQCIKHQSANGKLPE
jgi:hypothetical protein